MHEATDQLVLSNAVDQSISSIDFRPLAGKKVYLDTTYIRQVKSRGFVNADYITSSLRQQVVAAGCLLQENQANADIIIEARCGALGADGHQTTYGIPSNNTVSAASELLPSAPSLPTIPELSFARRESNEGAARIAAFAYDRESRAAVWQSGISESVASAKDTWVLGIGPFQGGTIRDRTKFAGSDLPFRNDQGTSSPAELNPRPPVDYTAEVHFDDGWPRLQRHGAVTLLSGDKAEDAEATAAAETPKSESEGGGAKGEVAVVNHEETPEPKQDKAKAEK